MSSKAEKDRGKQIEDKCQTLLTDMLRDEDNKYCVDCDAKGPRWASWNLGIFLCIRCAGIHRNLGVHISKVKSVNLDTWTPEQVVSLQQMGNSRARAVYEANIPDNFRRPQLDSALEAFIRAKYEHKKYIAKEWVPTPIPNVKQNWDKELDEEAERQKKRKKDTKQQQQQQQSRGKAETGTPQMLPKPRGSTSPRPLRSSPVVTTEPKRAPAMDLFFAATSNEIPVLSVAAAIFLSIHPPTVLNPVPYVRGDAPASSTASSGQNSASSNSEDIFSGFLSAPPAAPAVAPAAAPAAALQPPGADDGGKGRSAEEESFFNQPAPTNQEKRQLTKDSILALYGSAQQAQAQQPPPGAGAMFGVPGGVYTQPQSGFPPQPQSGFPPQPSAGMGFGMPNGMMGGPQAGMHNGMMGGPQAGIHNGMMGGPQAGMHNGMMGVQPTNAMFGVGVPQQGVNASLGMASNPFFNMGANPMANPMASMGQQGFPQMSQEHVVLPNQDLMSDSFSVLAAKHHYSHPQLPQQMGRMNIGPQTKQPGPMFPGQPMGMQMSQANAAMNAFPPSHSPGHTLATNLWQ